MEAVDELDPLVYRRVRGKDPNYWNAQRNRPEAYAFRLAPKYEGGKKLDPIQNEDGVSVDLQRLGGSAQDALGEKLGKQAIVSLRTSQCTAEAVRVVDNQIEGNPAHGLLVGALTDEDLERCDRLAKASKVEIDLNGFKPV